MYMVHSPLEQFEIVSLIGLRFSSFDFSFTNSSLLIVVCFFILFLSSQIISANGNGYIVPNRIQNIVEAIYKFISNIVFENLGKSGQIYFPFIFTLFIFLLLCNLLGLVPYSFTVTSHFIVTFTLSFVVWVGKLFLGFQKHGIRLFALLLPGGVPVAIIPFFVAVEFLSFFIPLVALGVRLFANIMAGHILLKVIAGFCWTIIISGSLFIAHFIPISVLFLLLFLETAVAFIQAYVFTMLACLMTGDCLRGGHLLFFSFVAQW
jgi:ATP synthase subunit 6